MKENAPEKLYLFENPISGTPDDRWLSKRSCNDDIKYVREDVFIEKACEWLEPVLKNYAGYYRGKDVLGDFKKYMEGE